MKKLACSLMIITTLLAGCLNRLAHAPGQPDSLDAHLTLTPWSPTAIAAIADSTSTPRPTLTALPLTVTSTSEPIVLSSLAPMGTTTVPPTVQLKFDCLTVNESIPAHKTVKGNILLQGWEGNPSYLLNVEKGEQTLIGVVIFMVVSPDGNKLAYKDLADQSSGRQLVIADANDQQQKAIPWDWEGGWDEIAQWLDDERLIITKRGDPLFSTIILNPFTGEQFELLPEYPNIYTDYPYPLWGGFSYSRTVYDPTLSHVLYPDYIRADRGIVLWNLQTNDALARFSISRDDYGQIPKWSPNGEQLAIVIDEIHSSNEFAKELYSISRDGQLTRLTYLTSQYSSVVIGEYSWSPDGRYIAFWLLVNSSQGSQGETLAILDTYTLEVTNYCIPGDDHWVSSYPPVWSPNGGQLAVESIQSSGADRRVILVDIVNGWAAQIAENVTPVGWMVSP